MRVKRFDWANPESTASDIRLSIAGEEPKGLWEAVDKIGEEVLADGDASLVRLAARFDGVDINPADLRVDPARAKAALDEIEPAVRGAMEVAAANIRAVSDAQVSADPKTVTLSQGHRVKLGEVPVSKAGVYAPGGRAAYASSVLMCAIPARVAGVDTVSLASPPNDQGEVSDTVLAAAALCEIDEIYAVGGAQAIFGLAYGTETLARVDVIVGPGNTWVQEAKRIVSRFVGIDSYAGPSELMVIAGHDANPEWVTLDLCAQAEHGADSPLVVVSVEKHVLDSIAASVGKAVQSRPSVADASLALVHVPDTDAAIELANAFAPEHLELIEEDAALLTDRVRTAGCVFVGRFGATAFGDYAAGSNHVLPTSGAGRFSGPLGPGVFRRKISAVEIPAEAAAKLAPHVKALAEAEGFPVHGESAMIRAKDD